MAAWVCTACSTTYAVGAPACPHCGATTRTEQGGGSVLPTITVACATTGCTAEGVARRVHLRSAVPGLVEMPALLCIGCGCAPAFVSPWPPEGEDMAKITVHGGPSNAAERPEREYVPGEPLPELPAEEDATPLPAPGEEEPSPGNSSPPSSPKDETKPEPSARPRRSRARTTANRSKQAQTGSSTAAGTDGDQTEPTSATAADGE